MSLNDPQVVQDALAALEIIRKIEQSWQPPKGPFVVSRRQRELIADVEALPENETGRAKDGRERRLQHWFDNFRRARLLPRSCSPS